MKQLEDIVTLELQMSDDEDIDLEGPKRPVGRPVTNPLSPKEQARERQKARRDRLRASGMGFLTVALPLDVIAALDKFVQFKDMSKDDLLERIIRRELMRKR